MLHASPAVRRLSRALTFLTLNLLIAACNDDSPNGPTSPVGGVNDFRRLLVADATEPALRLLDLRNDSTVATYALAAPASALYRTGTGRFAVAQQRTANKVGFFDAGVWTDGNAGYRRAPSRLAFELNESQPTHENVNGEWISIFFDGTGRAVWMNENDLVAGTPRVAITLPTGGPQHSGSATMKVGTTPFFVVAPLNPLGGLPASIEVRNEAGAVVASVPSCPSLHGNSAINTGVVFGCEDGMALVRANGVTVSATKVVPSGDMAGLGLRNAYAQVGASFILGQFAALPGQPTQRVLATINPVSGAINRLPALPQGVVDHWRAIEPVQHQIVLLGTNGALYIYDGNSRALLRTVSNVVPALPATGAATHQVSVLEGVAAVASPTTGEVVLVELATGTITRRIKIGGAPSRVVLTGAVSNGSFALTP